MTSESMRTLLKRILPKPVRSGMRAGLHYTQRVMRWPIILWQVRGQSSGDQLVLLASAVAAPVLSFRNLSAWQDPILLKDAGVVVPGIGAFKLRARTDDLWHILPWREQSIANLLRESLKPGDSFVDAGANIGIYTVLASTLVGPSGRVISIEMMPDTADRLESHVRMNQLNNVTVIRNALSDRDGEIVVARVQKGKHGQATIAVDATGYGNGETIEVETVTLDAITSGISVVRIMKIDVEGAEFQALSGAELLLQKLQSLVYESWGSSRERATPVDQLLEDAGYELRQLDGNNWVAERLAQQ